MKPLSIGRAIAGAALIAAIMATGFILRACWLTLRKPRIPSYKSFSGPIKNGYNGLGVHGPYGRTIDFTPDALTLAYVWQDASYVYLPKYEGRPCTLTESLEIRVRSITDSNEEFRIPLDSIDLRPEGELYFSLGVSLKCGPDSRHVAALCARRLVLIDLKTHTHREIEYPGEYFGSFSWLSTNTLTFSTVDEKSLTYWRCDIDGLPSNRVKVYGEHFPSGYQLGQPPDLRGDQWSPNGKYVYFTSFVNNSRGDNSLLDLQTGILRTFPFSLYYQCWKPDCTAVLIHDKFGDGHRTLLLDPLSGEVDDLSKDFEKEFGNHMDLTFVAPVWTPDGKYVILYNTSERSTAEHRVGASFN